jgi:hypothetical protein
MAMKSHMEPDVPFSANISHPGHRVAEGSIVERMMIAQYEHGANRGCDSGDRPAILRVEICKSFVYVPWKAHELSPSGVNSAGFSFGKRYRQLTI